jgi:hypothetical protein
MAEAATAEEVVDEETTCQSVLRLRASGPAGTSVSLPVPSAAQLLTLASLVSLAVSPGVAGSRPRDDLPDESLAFPRGPHGWAIP